MVDLHLTSRNVGDRLNVSNLTLADAILDRLVHNAYRINLKGETKRKDRAPPAGD